MGRMARRRRKTNKFFTGPRRMDSLLGIPFCDLGSNAVFFPNAYRRVLVVVWGVWGRDRVRSDFGKDVAHVRARSRAFAVCPMRCALRIGLDGCRLGGAVCRFAVGIGGESLVWVTPCRCPVASCHVMSCHVVSSRVMSCHVVSCHVMSCRVVSRRVVSCRVVSCHVMSCRVASCRVMSCRVMSCHAM